MYWKINKELYDANIERYHKIADKDITVYVVGKFADCKHFGPFNPYFHLYTKGEVTENKDISLKEDDISIWPIEGYYSFSENCSYYISQNLITLYSSEKVGQGINNYGFNETEYMTLSVGKFLIPKGTEYYINDDGEFTSSQIVYTGLYASYDELAKDRFGLFKDLYMIWHS